MHNLKRVCKKSSNFCFVHKHVCGGNQCFTSFAARNVQKLEVIEKAITSSATLNKWIKKDDLPGKCNRLYTINCKSICKFVNATNDLRKTGHALKFSNSNSNLYKIPIFTTIPKFKLISHNYSAAQTRLLHIFNTNHLRNVKLLEDLEKTDSRQNYETENFKVHNPGIEKRRVDPQRNLENQNFYDGSNNDQIEINSKLSENPKNVLHNIFSILSQELKIDFKVQPSFSFQRNQWHCTYNLKWPEPVKISKHALTKKEASHKAAIEALTWLKHKKKINSDGQPLVYDKSDIKAIKNHRKILHLDNSALNKLNLINEELKTNFLKHMNLDENNAARIENTDLTVLENPWPLNNIKQKILHLNKYLAKENIELPIQKYRNDIIDLVNENRITIIKGEPGCGKSIRVPQYVLESWSKTGALEGKPCKIIVTQPRRIAAISLAEQVSFERQEQVGDIVGYQVRFKTNFSDSTSRILYCTTGILLRRLQTDPTLNDCTHIVLDEAHERDVNTDLLMNLLRYGLKLNPDLKLIVMSATIDTDVFQTYFEGASVFHVPGYTYPVKEYFINRHDTIKYEKTLKMCESNEPFVVTDDVISTIKYIHSTKPDGAILCFLPGWEDISQVAKSLPTTNDMTVLCLHSKLDISDQKKIFSHPPPGVRKVILSTNIAETSVTINDVVYVIDTGIEKQSRFDAEKGIMCIDQSWISQANAKQRKGRAGRVQPGECFHLYTKKKMQDFNLYPIPEILRTSLVKIVLDSKVYSSNLNAIEFLSHLPTPPSENAIIQAVNELIELDLLDENENLKPLGKTLSNFQMEPKLAKTIVNAIIFQCVTPIISIVSLFSEENHIFRSRLVNQGDIKNVKNEFSETSDHIAMMKIFEQWLEYIENNDEHMARAFCLENNLVFFKMYTSQKLRQIYFNYVFKGFNNEVLIKDDFSDNNELIKAVLLSDGGSLLRLSNFEKVKGRLKKSNVFLTRNNHKVKIAPESVNSSKTKFPSDFMVYINETRSNIRRTTIVRETSFIPLLSLLLFKNEDPVLKELHGSEYSTELESNDQVLLTLEKAKIQCICDRTHGEAIVKCKEILNTGISYYIDQLTTQSCRNHPVDTQWKNIVAVVDSLLLSYKI